MSILIDRSRPEIAYITLNRPEVYNSVNSDLAYSLIDSLKKLGQDREVRVVCITGNGRAFCAGQDLREATTPELNPGFENLLEKHYRPIIEAIVELDKPVVMAVNGVAAGAGANIALAGDIILASDQASFIQAFSGIGLIPDSGGTYHLPRLVGRARAMAYTMLADKIDAYEAERVGMVYKVFSHDVFDIEVDKILSRLASMPTKALALTKKLINDSAINDLKKQLDAETRAQLIASATDDYHEGVSAFLEKRKPIFTGK